jgi:hypothetical protein
MKYVTFQNSGLIDLRAIRIFGASSKESANPIGFFGTGLKYAIAIALRLGCTVTLYRGLEKHDFDKVTTRVRVDDFDVVRMDGDELGFTTNLGRTWEAWQAFRELWCNALDEGGTVHEGLVAPVEGHTTVVVSGDPFVEAYHKRGEIMLVGATPRWSSAGVEVHERAAHHAYYRNVRVLRLDKPARLTYNVVGHDLQLTEDRTLKHDFYARWRIRDAILASDDPAFVEAFVTAPPGSFEAGLDVSDGDPGDVFMRVVRETTTKLIANDSVFSVFRKKTRGEKKEPERLEPSPDEDAMLAKARVVCAELGLPAADYPVYVTDDLDDHVLGCVWNNETIFLARRTFLRGQNQVTGTLLEELVHRHLLLPDESRGMQNWLIDRLVSLVRPGS